MTIVVSYPHLQRSGEPRPMAAPAVWRAALWVRERLLGDAALVEVPVERVVGGATAFRVNGIDFAAHWDLEHGVTDENGCPALGVCEYDEGCPGAVLVSINRELTGDRADLLRGTVLHELGHAVFDAPSWVLYGRQRSLGLGREAEPHRRIFRSVTVGEGHLATSRTKGGDAIDWREWRANEFMGAFLAPPRLLAKRLSGLAAAAGLAPAARASRAVVGAPAYDETRSDPAAVDTVVGALAELFGVSERFIRVRLRRYDLLCRGG
ncbi:MAG: hypothetical protein IRY94_16255, partial [Rhodospirillaceae bacterium]|nr:hypothetical protein [Rhodospirillaceae bacterium]